MQWDKNHDIKNHRRVGKCGGAKKYRGSPDFLGTAGFFGSGGVCGLLTRNGLFDGLHRCWGGRVILRDDVSRFDFLVLQPRFACIFRSYLGIYDQQRPGLFLGLSLLLIGW